MKTVGIICEYNPFHLGHKKQIDRIRQEWGDDCAIVCLMSGNFVQRGDCAVFDKSFRAKAAIQCGADLVLELPVTYALSSAEGFAAGGIRILSGFCDILCFGTESGSAHTLMATAEALLSPAFSPALRRELESGSSFPAARQAALASLGMDDSLLKSPNDILAVEYCKAILSQGSQMKMMPILRQGGYHDTNADPKNPSATAVRKLLLSEGNWRDFLPEAAAQVFENAPLHAKAAAERAILAKLRTMTDAEFEALPYGSEGLWRKLMHASRESGTLEQILIQTKSKRYTRTRLERMVMCAFLGITREVMDTPAPYARVLAFNETGAAILKKARSFGLFPHIGDETRQAYEALETHCERLYGLFRLDGPASPDTKRRVYIKKT